MSATDELCKMLDERGAKWYECGGAIFWETHNGAFRYMALPHEEALEVETCCSQRSTVMTAAQAIEATLGATVTGETSDGYHTFNELYHHRAVLFSVIVRDHRALAWKSRLHNDGTMYDDMFIVGIDTPSGQATYHYDIEPYWEMFDCKELERAPEWDGHTPDEAIARIAALGPGTCRRVMDNVDPFSMWVCNHCGHPLDASDRYCGRCGRRVVTS